MDRKQILLVLESFSSLTPIILVFIGVYLMNQTRPGLFGPDGMVGLVGCGLLALLIGARLNGYEQYEFLLWSEKKFWAWICIVSLMLGSIVVVCALAVYSLPIQGDTSTIVTFALIVFGVPLIQRVLLVVSQVMWDWRRSVRYQREVRRTLAKN